MMVKIRQKNCLLISIALVITPCIVILMRMGPALSTEQTLSQRLAECHVRLQYFEAMYRTRQEDVSILTQYLGLHQQETSKQNQPKPKNSQPDKNLTVSVEQPTPPPETVTYVANVSSSFSTPVAIKSSQIDNLLTALSLETRKLISNATSSHLMSAFTNFMTSSTHVRLPTAFHFLPHLLDDPESLRPAYLQTKSRTDVSIVLGIPTVKREKQSYLLGTLQNIIDNMNEQEQNETLIIVYIGETDIDIVHTIANQIIDANEQYVEAGLIDIIAPSASYYPNFGKLRITLNDSLERVKWRSKQNLDFAYLMAYAQTKGTFYVQLEDDILVKRNFITTMKKYAITKSALTKMDQPSWFILDFCQLGFIGKMFKSAELPYLITFFQMFYNDKPVDWLLTHFIDSKVCRTDKDQKHCNAEKAKYWIHYRPSLFQHIGMSSSLKGKVQKLKDKQFGWKVPTYYAHVSNPPASVKSNITPYKNFLLKRAYRGETYFWGLLPQRGDIVQFIFEKPVSIRRFLFRSGNSEHPSDRFYNTSVEILTSRRETENTLKVFNASSLYNSTADGYFIVGSFDSMGVAEGIIDRRLGPIKEIRLCVHSDSENWVLLSEIDLQVGNGTENKIENVFAAENRMQHIGRIPVYS